MLIGATGFLGSTLLHSSNKEMNIEIIGTSAHQSDDHMLLDITEYKQVSSLVQKTHPDCIVNCAAMTDVGQCERNPQMANRINSLGPKNLADACLGKNIKLIHISTDAIFDGNSGNYTEDSTPSPINVYSRTKMKGEDSIKSSCDNYLILRSNFYGINPRGLGLLNWLLQKLTKNETIVGLVDIKFNPVWVRELAFIILLLASHSYRGVLNCSGNEVFTKYEFAKRVAYELGYLNSNIIKGLSEDVFKDAKRPRNTYLNNTKLRSLLNIKIHNLHEVISGSEFDEYRSKEIREV